MKQGSFNTQRPGAPVLVKIRAQGSPTAAERLEFEQVVVFST